jgi:hypothetical protein
MYKHVKKETRKLKAGYLTLAWQETRHINRSRLVSCVANKTESKTIVSVGAGPRCPAKSHAQDSLRTPLAGLVGRKPKEAAG